jgi:hypothetical protein
MKSLRGWDSYVAEASTDGDTSLELPLTPDETYVIPYPTRKQGRAITKAQREGDTDAMLISLLGPEAGARVVELSEDHPGYVLDAFLLDVMRKFGMIPEEVDTDTPDPGETTADTATVADGESTTPASVNGTRGKARTSTATATRTSRKRGTRSGSSSAASS